MKWKWPLWNEKLEIISWTGQYFLFNRILISKSHSVSNTGSIRPTPRKGKTCKDKCTLVLLWTLELICGCQMVGSLIVVKVKELVQLLLSIHDSLRFPEASNKKQFKGEDSFFRALLIESLETLKATFYVEWWYHHHNYVGRCHHHSQISDPLQ